MKWLRTDAVLAMHKMQIAEHGGADGVRDLGLLQSALARPQNIATYEPEADIARLAAAYGYGIAKNHPFIDGNGRAGRLALNLALVRLGYPPVVILKEQRAAYLRAMQQADKGDVGPLGEILARAMIDNLNRFIIPNVAGHAKLVPLAALVDTDLSLVALRAAAQRGRLDAHQRSDGQWLSTRKGVNEYKKSRRPGARRTTQ